MQPLGRKYTKHNCKWKVKDKGKNIRGWWEDNIPPNKTYEKRTSLKEVELELAEEDQYNYEQEDCLLIPTKDEIEEHKL